MDPITKAALVIVVPMIYSASFALFNFPQAFEGPLIEKFNISPVEVTSLYAINASSTIPVDFLMIKILQKFHLRDCALFFSLISALGTFLTHYAVSSTNYQMLVIARFLFGIGLESLYVVSGVGVEKWFPASEVTIINGVARVGMMVLDTLMVYLMPLLYIRFGSFSPVLICFELVSLFLLLCAVVFYTIEAKYQGRSITMVDGSQQQEVAVEATGEAVEAVELQDLSSDFQQALMDGEDANDAPENRLDIQTTPILNYDEEGGQEAFQASGSAGGDSEATKTPRTNTSSSGEHTQATTFGFKHIKHIPALAWYIMLFMTFGANCSNNFLSVSVDLISKRYSVDYLTAKNFVSVIPSSSMFFMVFFLLCLNKYGYKTHSYNLASFLYLTAFATMILLPRHSPGLILYICLLSVSAAGSLTFATSAAAVMLAGPSQASSITVAFMAVCFNLPSLAVTPFMGVISQARTPEAYQNCLYLLVLFSLLTLWASMMVYFTDLRHADRLLQRRSDDPWLSEYKEKLNLKIERILAQETVVE